MRSFRGTASSAAIVLLGLGLFALRAALGAASAPADPAGDLQAQYEDVLAALKNPPARGVLIAEIEPDSPAAAAGLRGGDIITEYYGERIGTLKELREQVADATAHAIVAPNGGAHVLLKAFRNNRTVIVQLPRAPLAIRAIEVQGGVPGPRNPAPNLRGTIAFDWGAVLGSAAEDAERGPAAFRITQQVAADAPARGFDEQWLGWQTQLIEADGTKALSGKIEIHYVDDDGSSAAAGKSDPAPATSISFHMLLGDFTTSAPFIVDELTARYTAADGAAISATAERVGLTLRASISASGGEGNPPRNEVTTRETGFPQNAIPQPAVPVVAAALPHEAKTVLAVQLFSVRDLLPRPGYVLQTLGKKSMPAFPSATTAPSSQTAPAVETAWQVDLLFCGMLVESYWYSDDRRLLAIRTEAVQPVVSRRVAGSAIAATGDGPAQAQPQSSTSVPVRPPEAHP